ncbi:tRNA dimethylallyltransferase-like isoform X2 [Dreissena polymorpha]|nr:tRNA dimethylallyltransferase-like isoform X2 [Dreissena polymorpha]XP_052264681.1 tRNA dimethylallyltransferase-like isoform X2 [Dreissena polymorpha]
MYKGLGIVTNKATKEELQMCRHHMIDFISPLKDNVTVLEYRNAAVPIIDSILAAKKTPIIVGGSNYYIESLLWRNLVNTEDIQKLASLQRPESEYEGNKQQQEQKQQQQEQSQIVEDQAKVKPAPQSEWLPHDGSVVGDDLDPGCYGDVRSMESQDEESTTESCSDEERLTERAFTVKDREKYEMQSSVDLHARLSQVDPKMADRLHPKDKRKIIRALEVYDRYGIQMSEVYRHQHSGLADNAMGGSLRYRDTCLLWIKCDQDVLDRRLDARVDKMLEQGLVNELLDFHRQYNEERLKNNRAADYTRGIFQSIGFKEFHDFLLMDADSRQTEKGQAAFRAAVEKLKQVTRKYARVQKRWIERRLLNRPCSENVPLVYGLDGTDVSRWDENVLEPATRILTALRQGETTPISPLPYQDVRQEFVIQHCKLCDVHANTPEMWHVHIKSKRHRKCEQSRRRKLRDLTQTLDEYIHHQQVQDGDSGT